MKNVCIFEPRDQYYQCRSVYTNISCLDNPVWQAHSFWNGAGIGLAASKPGLFISQNARLNNATSRNHTAHSKANSTHTFRAPLEDPNQDGQAPISHRSRILPAISAIQRVFRANGAGKLPSSITFAACPPAAFFHTTFVNSACSWRGVRL